MWVLLLGLGWVLQPPGHPAEPAVGRGVPSGCCGLCHSPHRARAQANGTRGASVTLGCPVAGTPLGRLRAVHWHFWGDPGGTGVTVCSRSHGPPHCDPPYGDRAALRAPRGSPGVLLLGGLRDGDAGTYSCLLVGDRDCACGEVTLRLGGALCSPPCSRAPPRSTFGLVIVIVIVTVTIPLLPPARGL